MRILISNPDSAGDLILREPLFSHLVSAGHSLVLLARPHIEPAARVMAPTAECVSIPVDTYDPFPGLRSEAILPLAEDLQNRSPDLLVLAAYQRTRFDEELAEALPNIPVIGFQGPRYPAGVVSAQNNDWLKRLAKAVSVDEIAHEGTKNHLLCEAILNAKVEWRAPRLTPTPTQLDQAKAILERGPLAGKSYRIACLTGERSWPEERWIALIRHAIENHAWNFLISGAPNERESNRRILGLLGSSQSRVALCDSETTFDELTGLIALSEGYVGRDSGPAHLAAALGRPVLVVAGAGHWPRFSPQAPRGHTFTMQVPCQGCGWFCHLEQRHCLTQIPLEPVIAALDDIARESTNDIGVHEHVLPRPDELALTMDQEAARLARERMWQLTRATKSLGAHSEKRPTGTSVRIHLGLHYFGAGNLGDDLMLAGFVKTLEQEAFDCRIKCATPFAITSQRQRFPSINWIPYTPLEREASIRDCDVWLGLGDTPFQSDTGDWMLEHLARELELCRRYGKPMFFLCVGANNREVLKDPRSRDVLSYAEHVWARDPACAAWIAEVAGPEKVTASADLANLFFADRPVSQQGKCSVGWLMHFEPPAPFSTEVFRNVLDQCSDWQHGWWIQESRELPGSEKLQFRSLPDDIQARLHLCEAHYESASIDELMTAWPIPEVAVSSRYHGLLAAAWSGARLVGVQRNDKLDGLISALECTRLSAIEDANEVMNAINTSTAANHLVLEQWAEDARLACKSFFERAQSYPKSAPVHAPRKGEVVIELAAAKVGDGWYDPEMDESSTFRWMGASNSAWLEVEGLEFDDYFLTCDIAHAMAPTLLDGLMLAVNGMRLKSNIRQIGNRWALESTIPLSVLVKSAPCPVRIEFFAEQCIRPCDINKQSNDHRNLSIAFSRIALQSGSLINTGIVQPKNDGAGAQLAEMREPLGRKLFFIRIRKTASTSVWQMLRNGFAESEVLDVAHHLDFQHAKFDRLRFVAGHRGFEALQDFRERPYVVTFLREPVERAMSAFYYTRAHGPSIWPEILKSHGHEKGRRRVQTIQRMSQMSIAEFIRNDPQGASILLGNEQTRALVDYGAEPGKEDLGQALANLESCDFVGLVEHLDESMMLLFTCLGWGSPGLTVWKNKTIGKPSTAKIDPEDLAALKKITSLDAQLYKRAVSIFERQRQQQPNSISVRRGSLPSAAEFRFDQAIHGAGWESRELVGGEWVCWIGANKSAWLDLSVSESGDHTIRCRIAHAMSQSILEGVALHVNDQKLGVRLEPAQRGVDMIGVVKAGTLEGLDGRVRIRISVQDLARPCDVTPGSTDRRMLGIALGGISLRPS